MTNLKKHELPDDELDNVSGGVFANGAACANCVPIDPTLPSNCDNCSINNGFCPFK